MLFPILHKARLENIGLQVDIKKCLLKYLSYEILPKIQIK